jgi:outer membrane biosynthesis protein TonB
VLVGEVPKRPTTEALQLAAGVGPSSRTGLKVGVAAAVVLLIGAGVFVERDALFGGSSGGEIAVAPPPKPELPVQEPKPEVKVPEPVAITQPQPPALIHGKINTRKVTKIVPAPVAETPPVAKEEHPYQARVAAVQHRYDQLVKQYGESQLTTLERAAISQALDDARNGRDTRLAASIPPAEAALDAAANRLNR